MLLTGFLTPLLFFVAFGTSIPILGMSCPNRLRKAFDMWDAHQKITSLRNTLKFSVPLSEQADLHYQIARAAWVLNPLVLYEWCSNRTKKALLCDPHHVKARELALLVSLRGLKWGVPNALEEALQHAEKLLRDTEARVPSPLRDAVSAASLWLKRKESGRAVLDFIAWTPSGPAELESRVVEMTEALFAHFQLAVWEVEDSMVEAIEDPMRSVEEMQALLNKGLFLLGNRYCALVKLGKVSTAVKEYGELLTYLEQGFVSSPDQDGSLLIDSGLALVGRFTECTPNSSLAGWATSVADGEVASAGSNDWINLFLAGHLVEERERALALWKAAQIKSTRISVETPPARQAAMNAIVDHLERLISEEQS
jgi:hypothetical protein